MNDKLPPEASILMRVFQRTLQPEFSFSNVVHDEAASAVADAATVGLAEAGAASLPQQL